MLFGPVVLGTNRVDESLPTLLGEAECAWLKLRRWKDFRRESQSTNWLVANKAFELVGVVKVHVDCFADRHVGQSEKRVWD